MQYLGCLFALLLGVVFIVFTFLGSVVNAVLRFFGLGSRRSSFGGFGGQDGARPDGQGQRQDYREQGGYREQDRQQGPNRPHGQQNGNDRRGHNGGKIFEKDESEYVDFEEV